MTERCRKSLRLFILSLDRRGMMRGGEDHERVGSQVAVWMKAGPRYSMGPR